MPTQAAKNRARAKGRAGQKPTTQAGEFVRVEMHKLKAGSGSIRSRRQAIAVGLSEARRAGVPLGPPAPGKVSRSVRRKAGRDTAIGQGRIRPSAARSRGARQAARTRNRRYHRKGR